MGEQKPDSDINRGWIGAQPVVGNQSNQATKQIGGWFVWFLGASCLCLAVLLVLMAKQNRSLRTQLEQALHRHSAGAAPANRAPSILLGILLGDRLQPLATFAAQSSDASQASAGSQSSAQTSSAITDSPAPAGTLWFFFGGGCDACEDMFATVERLATEGHNLGVGIVAIQLDADKPADLKHTDRGFPVHGVAKRAGTWLERVNSVPGLALTDHAGTVRGLWWGVIDPSQELEVRSLMNSLANGKHPLSP